MKELPQYGAKDHRWESQGDAPIELNEKAHISHFTSQLGLELWDIRRANALLVPYQGSIPMIH